MPRGGCGALPTGWGYGMEVPMYHMYWVRMCRLGRPCLLGLHEEWCELRSEVFLSRAWIMELMDVLHTLLRMVHPRLGVLVFPVVRKHALREMGVVEHRR